LTRSSFFTCSGADCQATDKVFSRVTAALMEGRDSVTRFA
jgi:hypothetical protein